MRCAYRTLIVILLPVTIAPLRVFGEAGIVLEKSFPWSPQTEVTSVKEFSRLASPDQFDTGYREYFVGVDGKKFSVERNRIAKLILFPDIEAYTDIQDETQLSPLLADVRELKDSRAMYPLAKQYLERQIAKLQAEITLFQQGARKTAGTWHSAVEIARQKKEAADRVAKLEAERKAEEARLAATRAEEERSAAERRAAAQAILAKRIADFRKDVAAFVSTVSLPASDFKELKTLSDVKELPVEAQERISAFAEKVRRLRETNGSQEFADACQKEILAVDALEVRLNVGRKINAGDAADALGDLTAFFQKNSSDQQDDLGRSLSSIRSLCSRLSAESKSHLQRAESLSSSGKVGDAIQEFQVANRIFPNPKIAETIKQLRESSLGL